MAEFFKVAFSLHRAALAARKEAKCCWCESCKSFSIRTNDINRFSSVDSELEGGISLIGQVGSELRVIFAAA